MIRLKGNIIYDFNNGENLKIEDVTGVYDSTLNPTGWGGANIPATDVNACRFIFSSYLQELSRSTDSADIVAGYEYTAVGTGSFVYDTKTYNAGDTFICMATGTPTLPSTLILEETGRFQSVTDFLPTDVVSDEITPSLTGIDSVTFPNSVGSVQYDVYTTSYTAQVGIPAGTYLVYGTPGQTVTISGVTYRIGETFTQGGVFTMTGTASIALFYATVTDENDNPDYIYYVSGYYAWQALLSMQNKLAAQNCKCKDALRVNLLKAFNIWTAIQDMFSVPDGQIDIIFTQTGLDQIVSLSENCCKS